ncbi:MAG: hypothetical protein KF729_30160 [Sandaracinaceae bacterium]|nr:hypothetical protein [Sandaracinaceae bacterium]
MCEGGGESGRDGEAGGCATLDLASCQAATSCDAIVGYDVTQESGAGQLCYHFARAPEAEPILVQCVPRAGHAGNLLEGLAVDPERGRCLLFPSSSDIPADWAVCGDVMPSCSGE